MNLKPKIDQYLHHLQFERRVTPVSLKNYRSTVNKFGAWLADRDFTQQTIAEFMTTYEHAASANVILARLRGFANYHDVLTNKVVRSKEPVKKIEALTSTELTLLVEAASMQSKELAAVIVFLSETGLRFQEFVAFDPSHVRVQRKQIEDDKGNHIIKTFRWININGKGRKHRVMPLSRQAFEATSLLPLGLTSHRQDKLREAIAQAGIAAGLHIHVHPHLLRATFISIKLNELDRESVHVAQLAGHTSVDTMLRHYASTDLAKLYDVVDGGYDYEEVVA